MHRYVEEASSHSLDWSSASSTSEYVRLVILRDGQPVSTVAMGEELEMRWILVQDKISNVGLFLNRCIAERMDGSAPLPPPLTLIANGCVSNKVSRLLMHYPILPFDGGLTTKIKVFRFDGSRRVRILCSVDICFERCAPI
ncbi:unnamed protein product [Gongylonema pulchrum]|uniref:ZP domain-containing protein n=1 Tax=Gongylonema pulchrum TaxID=637853 RepID=A0A183DF01_9BILA|nr:unnamed protein product [Gongylonema pulchrum]